MKNLASLFLIFMVQSCGDLPENYFIYNEPQEKNMKVDLVMQFHDFLNSTNQFFENYIVSAQLLKPGVGGKISLVIDKSFYDFAKKKGKGNYPEYDKWIMIEFKDCINQSKVSSKVECNLSQYVFD